MRHPPATQRLLFHDLLLRSYLYHCIWSVITAHNLTPEKPDNLAPPQQHSAYSWHLSLLCVHVVHTLTRFPLVGLVPRSSVSLLLGFSAMLRVSLFSFCFTGYCTIICLGVYRHLMSGHEISRLQHCLECIMLVTLA